MGGSLVWFHTRLDLALLLIVECCVLGTIKVVTYLVLLLPLTLSPKHETIHSVPNHVSVLQHKIHNAFAS